MTGSYRYPNSEGPDWELQQTTAGKKHEDKQMGEGGRGGGGGDSLHRIYSTVDQDFFSLIRTNANQLNYLSLRMMMTMMTSSFLLSATSSHYDMPLAPFLHLMKQIFLIISRSL